MALPTLLRKFVTVSMMTALMRDQAAELAAAAAVPPGSTPAQPARDRYRVHQRQRGDEYFRGEIHATVALFEGAGLTTWAEAIQESLDSFLGTACFSRLPATIYWSILAFAEFLIMPTAVAKLWYRPGGQSVAAWGYSSAVGAGLAAIASYKAVRNAWPQLRDCVAQARTSIGDWLQGGLFNPRIFLRVALAVLSGMVAINAFNTFALGLFLGSQMVDLKHLAHAALNWGHSSMDDAELALLTGGLPRYTGDPNAGGPGTGGGPGAGGGATS